MQRHTKIVATIGPASREPRTLERMVAAGMDVARRLMELGFVPGERIRMLKRGVPGGDPLAVKVGQSTFALRRFEASLVSIKPE